MAAERCGYCGQDGVWLVLFVKFSLSQLESLPYWGSGKDEDITRLSPGWEARVTPEGRVFFVKYEKL